MNKLLLCVNIDHIATLRNLRGTLYPDPVQAAFVAEQAGADGITVHLREDRRHITDRDIRLLRETIQTKMNLEMSATEEMVKIACDTLPNFCSLVPERREEITTEDGLDVINKYDKLYPFVKKLLKFGIKVSLFINPDKNQIKAASNLGVSHIEIHTGKYSNCKNENSLKKELDIISNCAKYAKSLGLVVNAGHGLDYSNIKEIVKLKLIQEVNIGHAIISRASIIGLTKAVRQMRKIINEVYY